MITQEIARGLREVSAGIGQVAQGIQQKVRQTTRRIEGGRGGPTPSGGPMSDALRLAFIMRLQAAIVRAQSTPRFHLDSAISQVKRELDALRLSSRPKPAPPQRRSPPPPTQPPNPPGTTGSTESHEEKLYKLMERMVEEDRAAKHK